MKLKSICYIIIVLCTFETKIYTQDVSCPITIGGIAGAVTGAVVMAATCGGVYLREKMTTYYSNSERAEKDLGSNVDKKHLPRLGCCGVLTLIVGLLVTLAGSAGACKYI